MNDTPRTTLELRDISIEFPGVKALSHVDFAMAGGDIHALIGANGAGKSTLMKILAGVYDHYSGRIVLDGREVTIRSPRDAKELGIEIVYQEVDSALVPYLTVAENIMLNHIVTRMGGRQFVSWKEIHETARETLANLNMVLDTRKAVSELTLAQKQMVLIARATVERCRFLILDEPTAPLSDTETRELFRIVRDLSAAGVGVIFISHRLQELFQICASVTILRDGAVVKTMPLSDAVTPKDIVELMLGRKFEENFPKRVVPITDVLLEVEGLDERFGRVKNATFHVRKGEIVGISGLVGAGKTELCKTLFGALHRTGGSVKLSGRALRIRAPHHAVRQGIALVPEERRKEGVLVEEPVYSNLSASSLGVYTNRFGFIRRDKELEMSRRIVKELGIKTPSVNQKVAYLSGGNQQKVVVGKWLVADAEVYIFDEATKGVDVAAKHDIFELIQQLAAMGKGIVYASSELSEIRTITDRTYVMFDGEIRKELITKDTTDEEILYYSTGGR